MSACGPEMCFQHRSQPEHDIYMVIKVMHASTGRQRSFAIETPWVQFFRRNRVHPSARPSLPMQIFEGTHKPLITSARIMEALLHLRYMFVDIVQWWRMSRWCVHMHAVATHHLYVHACEEY